MTKPKIDINGWQGFTSEESESIADSILGPLGLTQSAIPESDRRQWLDQTANILKDRANQILAEKLAGAPKVWRMLIPLWMEEHARDLETVILSARLVCIEKMGENN